MRMQLGRIGTIRREVQGQACTFCGWSKYQLVLRCGVELGKGALSAQCSRCHSRRHVEEDHATVTTLFRYGHYSWYASLQIQDCASL